MTVSVHVCLSVREHISGIARTISVTHGRGSVLLWRHCDTLRTSGFMNAAIFAGRSGRVVNVSDCSVRGPRFESHHGRLCLS